KAKLVGERIATQKPDAASAGAGATGSATTGSAATGPGTSAAPIPKPLTAEFIDPQFNQPYVEVNELRTEPVPHRYVHGGFKGTDARFSFYFPDKDRYQGRFFHNTYPMATTSDIGPFPIAFEVATGDLGFCIDSGAYYVQTNLGGTDRAPPAD